MDLLKAQRLAIHLMEKHGVIKMGYGFAFNNARSAAGICSYRKKTIFLSKPLTMHSEEKDVLDTILHEIAHALTKGHKHDHVWRAKAIEIGCNGNRCYSREDKESTYSAFEKVAKVMGVCPNGHTTHRNRMPTRKQSCSQCSNRYEERYLITFTRK